MERGLTLRTRRNDHWFAVWFLFMASWCRELDACHVMDGVDCGPIALLHAVRLSNRACVDSVTPLDHSILAFVGPFVTAHVVPIYGA